MQGQRKPHTPFTKELLEKDYRDLHSTSKIANKYDVSKKCILNYMNKFGIERNKRKAPVEKVRYLANKNLSAPEIAEMLGFSATNISQIGRKYGIKIPDKFHVGFIITDAGYKLVRKLDHPYCDSKGYVREHRLIMEEYLGRFLEPYEIVHHINKNSLDNRIKNLELTTQCSHTKHHHIGKKGRGPDKKPRKKALRS